MRWQMLDRIADYGQWKRAQGIKRVSLEEYHLLERFGRKGFFPETLALQACVELVRWLVIKSSNFEKTCFLAEVDNFYFFDRIRMGTTIDISVKMQNKDQPYIRCECLMNIDGNEVAKGIIIVGLEKLDDTTPPSLTRIMWENMYVSS